MYKKLNAVEISSGLYVFPCTRDSSPTISLTFGGKDFAMDPDDVIIGASTVKYIRERFGRNLTGSDTDYYCRASIDIFDPPTKDFAAPSWIIGAAFMRNVYTVHRSTPPSIGFATVAGGDNTAESVPEGGSVNNSSNETVTNQAAQAGIASSAPSVSAVGSGLLSAALAAALVSVL